MSNYPKNQRTTYSHLRDEKANERKPSLPRRQESASTTALSPRSFLVPLKCRRGRREDRHILGIILGFGSSALNQFILCPQNLKRSPIPNPTNWKAGPEGSPFPVVQAVPVQGAAERGQEGRPADYLSPAETGTRKAPDT